MANPTVNVKLMLGMLRREKTSLETQHLQASLTVSSNPIPENLAQLRQLSDNLVEVNSEIEMLETPYSNRGTAAATTSTPVATASMLPRQQRLTGHDLLKNSPLSSRSLMEQDGRGKSTLHVALPSSKHTDPVPQLCNIHPGHGSEQAKAYRQKVLKESLTSAKKGDLPLAFPGTDYTHIVLIDDKPMQLVCFVCKATRGKYVQSYFAGIKGYLIHVRAHPTEAGLNLEGVLNKAIAANCLVEVDQDDVSRIRSGKEPENLVPLFGGAKQEDKDQGENGDDDDNSYTSDVQGNAPVRSRSRRTMSMPGTFDQLDPARYPTVMYYDRQWVEMLCFSCGGNVVSSKGRRYGDWFAGMRGFNRHAFLRHKKDLSRYGVGEEAASQIDIANLNIKRPLSSEDVELILAGEEPKHEIIKYADFDTPIMPTRTRAVATSGPPLNDPRFAATNKVTNSNNSFTSQLYTPNSENPPMFASYNQDKNGRASIAGASNERIKYDTSIMSGPAGFCGSVNAEEEHDLQSGTRKYNAVTANAYLNNGPPRIYHRRHVSRSPDSMDDDYESEYGTKRRKRSMAAEPVDDQSEAESTIKLCRRSTARPVDQSYAIDILSDCSDGEE